MTGKIIRKPKSYGPMTSPISISRTQGEWDMIQKMVSESGRDSLSSYIMQEIRKLKKEFDDCRECVTPAKGNKIDKRPYIPDSYLKDIEEIAALMDKPISAVINELIIAHLLRQGKA